MVPTPITKHSTRASRVKVGPRTAMPREMLSLTSSWTKRSTIYQSGLLLNFGWNDARYDVSIFQPTWELELKANLARAHALERSMRSRKKGKASLEVRTEQSAGVFTRYTDMNGQYAELVLTWGQWALYQESEWPLCWIQNWRIWWKGQQCLQESICR